MKKKREKLEKLILDNFIEMGTQGQEANDPTEVFYTCKQCKDNNVSEYEVKKHYINHQKMNKRLNEPDPIIPPVNPLYVNREAYDPNDHEQT